jgi:hypothetical protein
MDKIVGDRDRGAPRGGADAGGAIAGGHKRVDSVGEVLGVVLSVNQGETRGPARRVSTA